MALAYADEKFSAAIRTLAIAPGPIKPRLIEAIAVHLSYIQTERDLPEELRDDYVALLDRVTHEWPTVSNPADGRVQATIGHMTDAEAVEIADEILSFAYRVAEALEDERKPGPSGAG